MEFFCRVIPWILLLFTSTSGQELLVYDFDLDSNYTENSANGKINVTSVSCFREHLYDRMDIKEVLGKWKARVLYMHLSKEGVNTYNSCPIITIWEVDHFPTTTFGVGFVISVIVFYRHLY